MSSSSSSRPFGDRLINEAIKRILLDIVIRGHGDRLIGRWSREPELQQFLEQVPYMLDRINQLHLACCRKDAQDTDHHHHYHHHHQHHSQQNNNNNQAPLDYHAAAASGQGALDDFIRLIGEDRHWLVRTRDTLGLTPLHKAVLFHNRPLVEYIVDRYQDELAASSAWKTTPSARCTPHRQVHSLQPQAATRLLDAQDKYGRTALHYAAALLSHSSNSTEKKHVPGRLSTISHLYHFLVAKGASLSVQDFRGKTPAHYVRHPNQLRSKSIIHLANKLNANYQANVLTKTLRATNDRAPIQIAASYDDSQLDRTTTTELHRELMSTSCNDLRRSDAASDITSEPLDRKRSKSTVINSDEADLDTMMLVCNTSAVPDQTVELSGANQDHPPPAPVDSPLSMSASERSTSETSMDFTDMSSECRKQLIADRCPGMILDQRSKLSIRRCLNEGVIDKISEMLLAGHGAYLVREASVSCWNLQCKRYISQIIPSLLAQVDQLHEFIAANQLLAVKNLLSVDPILARIRRPYKRAAMNALHLAAQKNRSTIAKYLVQKFPELLNQQDSLGATCLHWAAKSVEQDRLYRWLNEHYGSQLEPVHDLRGKSALDYRQQALRLSEFSDSRPITKQVPREAREMLQKAQLDSDKLQLSGTKIDIKSKRETAVSKTSLKSKQTEPTKVMKKPPDEPPIRIGIESPSTGAGSRESPVDQQPIMAQGTRRASSSAQPVRGGPIPEVMRRLSDSSSMTAPPLSGLVSREKAKAGLSGDRFKFDDLDEVNEGAAQTDDQQVRARLLNELVQLDSNELDVSRSEGSTGATSTPLISPLATPSLPFSRPHSASTSDRLENMIIKCIELEDYQRLEHLILAGCGNRLLSVYKHLPSAQLDQLSSRMHHFLNNYTPDYIEKIAKIHQVLHKCFADSFEPDCDEKDERHSSINAAFHKLCNLLDRNRLIMCRDSHGASPLHIALLRADERLVDYLLRRHPDAASAPDSEKRNAVHYAALVLAAYNQHGGFKLTVVNSDQVKGGDQIAGYWTVAENAATIYENICSRYGELLQVKDRKGLTGTDYLDKLYEHSDFHQSKPINLNLCCQDYAQLLSRYNYVPLDERNLVTTNGQTTNSSSPDTPDVPEPSSGSKSRQSTVNGADNLLLTQSLNVDPVATGSLDQPEPLQTSVKQVASRPIVGGTAGFSTPPQPLMAQPMENLVLPSKSVSSKQHQEQQPQQRDFPASILSKRHHRRRSHALLDDLDPNHRAHYRHHRHGHHHHHHSARKSPTGANARQSIVGGVIVPTIIHNDKMDEIETYDIIYRQPPTSSSAHVSSSSNSSSFSSSDGEELDVATLKHRSTGGGRQTKVKESVKMDSGSSSGSELDDEDERVERLSNEFEIRVRREKSELRAKVDQIMNEIKMSAKSGKSSRFLSSPIQPPGNEQGEHDRNGNTVMFLNGFSSNKATDENGADQQVIANQQAASSLSSSGHSSCSSASSLGSTCSQSASCSSANSRTANSSSTCSTATSSKRAQSTVIRSVSPQNSNVLMSAKQAPSKLVKPSALGSSAIGRVASQAIQELNINTNQVVSKNTYGQTYLHFIASRSQSSSTLYKVLEHGRHMIGERDIFYRTARDVALQFNLANNVQVLDKFVIDLFVGGSIGLLGHLLNQGYSPLIHVSDPDGNDIMLILKLLKLERMIHFLLQMADFQRWRDELHTFIRNGYSAGVSELIRKHPDLVKAKSMHSRTSLHLAVLFDRPNMVKELLDMDPSSVQATDNMGRTALHYTYGLNLKNVEEIRDLLLSNGASLETRDVKMRTPKYYYIFKREIEEIKRMELELN